MNFGINPLGPVAAEIIGLDCARALPDEDLQRVKCAYRDYPVLIFRDQQITASALAAFGRQFGRLEGYDSPFATAAEANSDVPALTQITPRETPDQFLYLSPDDPDVTIMTNVTQPGLIPVGVVDNAEVWHSDGSHKAEPYSSIIVYVVRNPPAGGDTEFCDMRAVYKALPPELQERLVKYIAVHHWSKSKNPRFAGTLDAAAIAEGKRVERRVHDMPQPVVRTHPETGQNSIYVSPRFTLRIHGIPDKLSSGILEGLFTFMEDPAFHYRHVWRENDLMIWDNRCLNHRVRSFSVDDDRCRLRIAVAGEAPFFRREPPR